MKDSGFVIIKINELSSLTFPFSSAAFNEGKSVLHLAVAPDKLTDNIQENMLCRIEFGVEEVMEAEVRSIDKTSRNIRLACAVLRASPNAISRVR